MYLTFLKYAVCAIALSFLTSSALAADGGSLKVGVMNVQKVLVQSEPGVHAKAVFEKKKDELEATFRADQEKLQKMQEEIEKKSSVWSKEKKDEQVLEFNRLRRDLQTKSEDARMEMKRLQDKELEPIIKQLETVVDTYGEKNGFSIILDSKNGVIFYNKTLDISDALIEELNKVMK